MFSFVYRATLDGCLIEHEYDHVHVGVFDGVPNAEPSEVEDWRWVAPAELVKDVAANEERYTYWFRLSVPQVLDGRV